VITIGSFLARRAALDPAHEGLVFGEARRAIASGSFR